MRCQPYSVSVYRDLGGRAALVHHQWCPDRALARDFAMSTLLDTYLLLIEPRRDDERRLFWCELLPGRQVDGRWQPAPVNGGEVDTAYLDERSGEICWDLAASGTRWRLLRQGDLTRR